MSLLASLALLVAALPQTPAAQGSSPQGGAPGLLTATEQGSLRDKLAKFLADDGAVRMASDKEYDKLSRTREKSKDAFDAELKKLEKKGNIIGSMPDLRAMFEGCFLVKAPPSGSVAALKKMTTKDGLDFSMHLPKPYRADKPWRTIIVVPGTAAVGAPGWAKPADYFTAVWDKAAAQADTIFHIPHVADNLELDPIPDYSHEGADAEEDRRIKTIWTLNDVMQSANVDRSRVFLDCGRGACGFALRFATLFPERFAGLVLREPSAVDDLRLGSLTGMPILLLRSPANAAVVDALKTRLEAVGKETVVAIDAADEYPHKGATAQIEEWLGKQRRNMMPATVIIEPNHDRFNRAYWADIDTADSLLTTAPDKKPRLEVKADRATNRITVKAVGVERFILSLNDSIVDLDKEFTIVVNDKAFTEKKTRSFRAVWEGVQARFDWDCLFSAKVTTTVPKP